MPTLEPTPFRGDVDVADLRAFFAPAHQYAGDVKWTFGTSLRSAYVNSFEFVHHAPVVQLWRARDGTIGAVSRLSLGTGEWFHQAAPGHRSAESADAIIERSDQAMALLTAADSWSTVRYEGAVGEIEQLLAHGYERSDRAEVFMERGLDTVVEAPTPPSGVRIDLLDHADADHVHERAMAQVDAFSAGTPTPAEIAWIGRTMTHQLAFARHDSVNVVAVVDDGTVVSFADPFFDRSNSIGEFEPVGTRHGWQGQGLARCVLARGLAEMQRAGMRRAVVRTGVDNTAAIAAYESVGFEVTDHLVRFVKAR